MDNTVLIEDKGYKIRKLNVLDIRSVAKILKEVGITKAEIKESLEKILKQSQQDKNNKKSLGEIKAENYIGAIMPLVDEAIKFLCDCDSFWEFLKDITTCDDLSKIPLSELKNIINTLIEDNELLSFFTGLSTQKEEQEK